MAAQWSGALTSCLIWIHSFTTYHLADLRHVSSTYETSVSPFAKLGWQWQCLIEFLWWFSNLLYKVLAWWVFSENQWQYTLLWTFQVKFCLWDTCLWNSFLKPYLAFGPVASLPFLEAISFPPFHWTLCYSKMVETVSLMVSYTFLSREEHSYLSRAKWQPSLDPI
jgi:hypothetical protein